jgi:hypothetical protein
MLWQKACRRYTGNIYLDLPFHGRCVTRMHGCALEERRLVSLLRSAAGAGRDRRRKGQRRLPLLPPSRAPPRHTRATTPVRPGPLGRNVWKITEAGPLAGDDVLVIDLWRCCEWNSNWEPLYSLASPRRRS